MDFIFFGMQGSGKGTLGKFLADKYQLKLFETGGELRRLAEEDSDLGRKIKSIIEAGHLVSNEVVMEIVENFLNHLEPNISVLFDGIPRSLPQAETLKQLLEKHNRNYKAVELKIAKSTALDRLTSRRLCQNDKTIYPADYSKDTCEKCGGALVKRADDNPEAIEQRLSLYFSETVPAMELFADHLIIIDGEPNIEEVQKLAVASLDPLMS